MASQLTPRDDPAPSVDPAEELASLGQPWWRRYSKHGEFPWSSGSSLALHLFLVVLLIVFAQPWRRPDPLPPQVGTVLIDDSSAGDDALPDTGDSALEPQSHQEQPEPMQFDPATVEKVETPEMTQPIEIPLPKPDTRGEKTVQEARERLNSARSALNRQLASPGKESPSGAPGGSGAGRSGRAARWHLRFKTVNPDDYLAQLEGLGAAVAFEVGESGGGRWRFFDKPWSEKEEWHDRGLDDESRLFWIDDTRATVRSVAELLRVPAREFMVAFLPQELERKMLELELTYQNRREEEIETTVYEVVRRGGKYDVFVIKQILKGSGRE